MGGSWYNVEATEKAAVMGLAANGAKSCIYGKDDALMSLVRETHLLDVNVETGEVTPLSSSRTYRGSMLGDGYIVVYKSALERLLSEGASYTSLRIYLKLMSLQNFGAKVIIRNKYMYESLGICERAFYKAMKWLIENDFVKKSDENGYTAYLLNPKHTACGTASLQTRSKLWSIKAPPKKPNSSEEALQAKRVEAVQKAIGGLN